MSRKTATYHGLRVEQGAALMVALVILTMISVIGVASLKESVMQSRIAANTNANGIAFQAADTAIESAIAEIQGYRPSVEGQPHIIEQLATTNEAFRCVGAGVPPDECAPLQGPGNVCARSMTAHANIPDRPVTGSSTDTIVWRFYLVSGTSTVGADALAMVSHEQEIARREIAANDEVFEERNNAARSALP